MEKSWETTPDYILRKIFGYLKSGSPESVYFCYTFKLWSILEKKCFLNQIGRINPQAVGI